jgi:ATP:ADP antiporter, AAA family
LNPLSGDRLQRLLSRFADLRPGESRTALLLFLYFFLVTFPVYIVKPVKVSLFFIAFSARYLPFAYLLTAALIGFAVALNIRLMKRLPRPRYLAMTSLFFMASLVLFWGLFKLNWRGTSLIYWFWSDMFIATTVTQFWICVNDVLHPYQAKRLVGFFVSGGLLGGIGGSLLAMRLARSIGTENLLLVCPALLVLMLVVAGRLYRAGGAEDVRSGVGDMGKVGFLEGLGLVRRDRYLLLLAGLLGTAAIVGNLIDFQFSTILSWNFINKDPRTAFLATFNAALLVVSYFAQLFGTGRILRRFGVRAGLLAAPALLAVGSAAVFLFPFGSLILWAVLVRGTAKGLENTIDQSVRELLYIPIAPAHKYRAKMFIDMFVNKFAAAAGGLLLLLFYTVLRIRVEQVSFLVLAFLVLWAALALRISGAYVGVVRKDLARRWEDGEKVVAANVDIDSARLVFDTIQSRERSSILYAMNVFDLVRKDKMTPELKEVLSEKSGELMARSMDSLLDAGGEAPFAGVDDALSDTELGAEIGEVFGLESYRQVMGEHLETVAGEGRGSEIERMEAAKVLGMMRPEPSVVRLLSRLLRDDSPDVVNYALDSAVRLGQKEHVPLIVRQLADARTRRTAVDALAAFGNRILGALVRRLEDRKEDLAVRQAIPEVLVLMGGQKAADALVAELLKGDGAAEPEIIGALYRIRSERPDVVFREKRLVPAVLAQVRSAYRLILEGGPGQASGGGLLAFRIKWTFELLSLIYPAEDVVKAYQNICRGTRKSIDYSLELLDNVVANDLKEFLFPLVEDLPPEERARKCGKLLRPLEKRARKSSLKGASPLR